METKIDFSVIIPTYRRPAELKLCLQSLASQDYPSDRFEVIVVDDGSGDPPSYIVDSFNKPGIFNVKLLIQEHAGPAAARNTGAAKAQGEYLVFTDDDCALAPDWLTRMHRAIAQNADRAAAGGHTVNALNNNIYSAASQALIDYLYSYYNQAGESATFLTSNNVAFPASLFRKVGGFDTSFPLNAGEDRELCDRWVHYQLPITYVPDAVVHHYNRLTLKKFFRQHFNYGRGAHRFHQVRAARERKWVRVEPPKFYFDLIRFPFGKFEGSRSVAILALMVFSQVANASGFAWELFSRRSAKKRRGWGD